MIGTCNIDEIILNMPMVKKYRDEYQPVRIWACDTPIEIQVFFKENAHKNYFTKTIQQIKALNVLDVVYEKAQDETVSDCLRIWIK